MLLLLLLLIIYQIKFKLKNLNNTVKFYFLLNKKKLCKNSYHKPKGCCSHNCCLLILELKLYDFQRFPFFFIEWSDNPMIPSTLHSTHPQYKQQKPSCKKYLDTNTPLFQPNLPFSPPHGSRIYLSSHCNFSNFHSISKITKIPPH